MSIRIKKGEWKIAFAVAGVIDFVQMVIAFTGVGLAVSEVADIVIGILLVIYFLLRGFSLGKHLKLFLSLLGIGALEELTGGVAPAWILDIYYAQRIAKAEEAEINAQKEQVALGNNVRQPFNEGGMRLPRTETGNTTSRPANFNGMRAPGGGLKMTIK